MFPAQNRSYMKWLERKYCSISEFNLFKGNQMKRFGHFLYLKKSTALAHVLNYIIYIQINYCRYWGMSSYRLWIKCSPLWNVFIWASHLFMWLFLVKICKITFRSLTIEIIFRVIISLSMLSLDVMGDNWTCTTFVK